MATLFYHIKWQTTMHSEKKRDKRSSSVLKGSWGLVIGGNHKVQKGRVLLLLLLLLFLLLFNKACLIIHSTTEEPF